MPPVGSSFFAHVYHPSYSLDMEECKENGERFVRHLGAMEGSMHRLRSVFGKVRESRAEDAFGHRLFGYSILGLINSISIDNPHSVESLPYEEDEVILKGSGSNAEGLVNNQRAWCWRDNCEGCLGLTAAMQKMAESLQYIASIEDTSANQRQLAIHEHLKDCSHPLPLYEPIIDVHRGAQSHYEGLHQLEDETSREEMTSRCETVLNISAAEMDVYHEQKVEDFRNLAKDYLDGEIELHEKVLQRLRNARGNFEANALRSLAMSPRQPSIFERDLGKLKAMGLSAPLAQPCPHVFDSAPMRPVSSALQEGVGLVFGKANTQRSSILSRFW